jgi:hypothetical protein
MSLAFIIPVHSANAGKWLNLAYEILGVWAIADQPWMERKNKNSSSPQLLELL